MTVLEEITKKYTACYSLLFDNLARMKLPDEFATQRLSSRYDQAAMALYGAYKNGNRRSVLNYMHNEIKDRSKGKVQLLPMPKLPSEEDEDYDALDNLHDMCCADGPGLYFSIHSEDAIKGFAISPCKPYFHLSD